MNPAVALLAAPLVIVSAITIGAGGAVTTSSPPVVSACSYTTPDAGRIAATFEALTTGPVDEPHWDRYAPPVGLTIAWSASTLEQRHQVLVDTVTTILATTVPNAITTPVIIWWHGALPATNDDVGWQTDTIPGWTGTLASYLAAFTDTYTSNPAVQAVARPTPECSTCSPSGDLGAILATIRHRESNDNYTEHSRARSVGYPAASGNPTGAYQYLTGTWNRYGGYDEAYQAPAAIQDERATTDVNTILATYGNVDWVPVVWYVGAGGANHIRDGTWPLGYIPNQPYNTISIGDYQHTWLDTYTALTAGTPKAVCSTGAAAAIAWAETQIGAPYATINPYRFGTPPWPGGNLIGLTGRTYNYPAGTIVYDCSGFVIAAWRHAGIDYPAQYGIYTSDQWATSQLPNAPPNALQPGDIAIYSNDAQGNGHVVLIHDTDTTTGIIHTIESSGTLGVHIGTLDWTRTIAIKRTP